MKNVLVLQVIFKWDLEHCKNEIGAINRAIAQKFKRAMHASRNMAFVITTHETEQNLMNRLAFVLDQGCIEDAWCFEAPRVVVSTRKTLDTLENFIRIAYSEIGKSRNPKYIEQRQRPAPRREVKLTEDVISSTPVKVFGESPPKRRKSERFDKYDRD